MNVYKLIRVFYIRVSGFYHVADSIERQLHAKCLYGLILVDFRRCVEEV